MKNGDLSSTQELLRDDNAAKRFFAFYGIEWSDTRFMFMIELKHIRGTAGVAYHMSVALFDPEGGSRTRKKL